ncbi:hypothetical protein [Dokdonella sp.]|uniref:hypothetical protein n=1 Tax=Dokdonella sp. TaxID=2291710 RepID=UPI001B05FAA2|nr:hypothetical protein [Dokdonella sp.]MBO9663147.1 hypothetical protein [Dokdonella sp.]
MTSNTNLKLAIALIALLGANAAFALKPQPPAEAKDAKPVPAASSARPIHYEELEQQIGAEIAVETTLNTVRRGTLIKYTNPTLTLKLGPQMGSIDFSVPRDTVRSITLITPAPQPAAQENGSAQKN